MKIKDIIKTENIIKVSPEEKLAAVLKKLHSSHDAAFVFDDDKFLGLINPYYTIIKNSYPGNAKVKNCLYHPPKIKINFPLTKLVELFNQTKIHYLPLFDEQERFLGIISARRVLAQFLNHPLLDVKIKELLDKKKQTLITIYEDQTINNALNLFKNKKISKLVVVDKGLKLKGIISYYDLIDYLILPKEKEGRGDRVGGKINFHCYPIIPLIKKYTLTLKESDLLKESLRLIIEKKIGSVIIIGENQIPIGIITTRDLLSFIFQPKKAKEIEIITKDLSQENRQILGGFFNNLKLSVQKLPGIIGARLLVKEEKQGRLFKAVLSLFPKKGTPIVVKREEKNFSKLLRKLHR